MKNLEPSTPATQLDLAAAAALSRWLVENEPECVCIDAGPLAGPDNGCPYCRRSESEIIF